MCSLSNNFDDFQYLILSTNINFDVMAVSESRIIKNKQSLVDINLPDCSYEFCPTESSARGTLLDMGNHLSYKLRKDLSIYKSYELESTFPEICIPKKTKIIIINHER